MVTATPVPVNGLGGLTDARLVTMEPATEDSMTAAVRLNRNPQPGPNPLSDGIYSVATAARLTRLPYAKLRHWIAGYRSISPVLPPDYHREDGEGWHLSFLDLVELKIIGELRQAGVAMREIRRAHREGCQLLGVSHPFATRHIWTDGQRVYVDHKAVKMDLGRRQYVMEQVIEPFLCSLSFDPSTGLAESWQIGPGVEVNPKFSMGVPVVSKSKVPTSTLADAVEASGGEIETAAKWYRVEPDEVRQAIEFERGLRTAA